MAEKLLEGTCPVCGKPLQIPEGLEEFSCLYCGQRMKAAELIRPDAEAEPPVMTVETAESGEAARALQYAKDHILDCVRGQQDLRKAIRKDDFESAFARYEEAHAPVFRQLEAACRAEPENRDEMISEVIETLLQGLEADWEAAGRRRTMAAEDDKVVVAIFLAPMVRHLKLGCSEDFAAKLQATWVARYPKNPFYLGSYEELSAGFRKKYLGLCFITTAVCEQEGKPDDCAELTAFRAFRDGWLRRCPDGPALIDEYYEIAPAIVTMLGVCADKAAACGEIRSRWLGPCYEDLRQGRMEACKARYIDMVRTLEQKYLQ